MDKRSRTILNRCNFALFLSIAVPDADPHELRTVVDWGNWVCPYTLQHDSCFDIADIFANRFSRLTIVSVPVATIHKTYNSKG